MAIWGTFDVTNYGDLLFPRVFEHELRRRLPDATIRPFSPLGRLHPLSEDGGFTAEPLGPWSTGRLEQLAGELDFVAIGPGEIIHEHDDYYADWYSLDPLEAGRLRPSVYFIEGLGAQAERSTPVAWHACGIPFELQHEIAERVRRSTEHRAYVSVRDEASRVRLERAGVERAVWVVPDPALLMRRHFSEEVLRRRLDYLRTVGSFPAGDGPLVVQGSRGLVPHAGRIGQAIGDALANEASPAVLLLETGRCHGDHEFADALAAHVDPRVVYRMPRQVVVEDVMAAIAHARAFAGVSLHGNITAFAHEVPFAILDLVEYSKLRGFAELVGASSLRVSSLDDVRGALARVLAGERPGCSLEPLAARIDAHFDRMAELAATVASHRVSDARDGSSVRATRHRVAARTARAGPSRRWARRLAGRLAFATAVNPVVSIVVPTHGGWQLTKRVLSAVRTRSDEIYEVIVCDNASTDETPERLGEIAGLRLILNARNLGFPAACNQGAALARSPYVVFLNSDAVPHQGWLTALLERLEADRSIGAVGPRFLNVDGSLQEAGATVLRDGTVVRHGNGRRADASEFARARKVDYVSGACLALRRSTFHEAGGFDVAFGLGYFEDVDLCFRLRALGYDIVCEPHAVVTHVGGASSDDATRQALFERNRRLWRSRWQHAQRERSG